MSEQEQKDETKSEHCGSGSDSTGLVSWRVDEPAPKDGSVLLLDVGMPWAVAGTWNPVNEEWVYASLQVGEYLGKYNDTYFENETDKEIYAWMPMPELLRIDGWTLGAIDRGDTTK